MLVIAGLVIGAGVVWIVRNGSTAANENRARIHDLQVVDARLQTALEGVCALRGDLVQRVHDSKVFLRRHPQGLPSLGFSRADILAGIRNEQATVTALAVVRCPNRRPR